MGKQKSRFEFPDDPPPRPTQPTPDPALDDLLTVDEVAAFLKLTPKGVYSMTSAHRIPFIRVSNRLRFLRRDVVNWLLENRVPALEKSS
jgi:excisionase family DNA binding protein